MNDYLNIIALSLGILINGVGLALIIIKLFQSNEFQRINMFHDVVKYYQDIKDKNESIDDKKVARSRILNYFEYLGFLYFKGAIDKKMTEEMFKPDLIDYVESYRENIKPEHMNLKNLCKEWKIDF